MSDAIADVVRARRIEIIDSDGVVRIVLGTVDRGDFDAAVLGLCAPDGREHLTLYCDELNRGFELWEGGNNVASLSSHRDGSAWFSVADPDTAETVVGVKNHGSPVSITHPANVSVKAFGIRVRGTLTVREG